MKFARKIGYCAASLIMVCVMGLTAMYGQTGPVEQQTAQKPLLSEQAFKNVQVLRGIPVKEFMETMGFFAASLALNCTDCHGGASASDWANYATDTDLPLKQMARRMVIMVNGINAANFAGARKVTCYTCHRGNQVPKVVPSLAAQYATPSDEDPDEVTILPGGRAKLTPDQILDKYIQAVGGAAALAKLTSFTAKGTYEGFDSDFGKVPVDIFSKAPNMRAVIAHMSSGDSTIAYDGRDAWSAGPTALVPVPLVPLTGADLEGASLDAQLAFPGQIKNVLSDWRGGYPPVDIDGKAVNVIDGKMPGGARIKLYFDAVTGLLVRQARFTDTAVGTVATHVVYADYRLVAGTGVKMPYKWEVTWVDGQSTINLTSVQPNAAIDAAKFGKPAPPK